MEVFYTQSAFLDVDLLLYSVIAIIIDVPLTLV
jgi:hypothetical protein